MQNSGPLASALTQNVPPLRAVRKAKGLSLRTVATRAGLDPGHLSKVERGQAMLGLDGMHRLAVVLGLTEFAQMLALYLPRVEQQ